MGHKAPFWTDNSPEYPFVPIDNADDDTAEFPVIKQPRHRLRWAVGVTAVGLALAGTMYGVSEGVNKRKTTAAEIKQQQDYERTLVVVRAAGRAAAGSFGYCNGHEVLAPRKYHRSEILTYNNMLRGALGLPPLAEDTLLDRAAQQAAQRLANNPVPRSEFQIPTEQKTTLALQGEAAGKWSEVDIQLMVLANGQTARAVSCLMDSTSGALEIKKAKYIGIGSARSRENHRRYLAIEYGINTG